MSSKYAETLYLMIAVQNKFKNTLVGVLRTQITFVTRSSPSCYVTLRTSIMLNSGNLGPKKTDSGVFIIVSWGASPAQHRVVWGLQKSVHTDVQNFSGRDIALQSILGFWNWVCTLSMDRRRCLFFSRSMVKVTAWPPMNSAFGSHWGQ